MTDSNCGDSPGAWEVLSSEHLFQRPWLTVRQDRVRLPTGHVIDEYYVLEYPTWVNVVAVTCDDQFVMVRQYRHGLRAVHYELPAGVVDGSEEHLAACRRELLEETGFGGGRWSPLLTTSANPGTHTNLAHSFLALGVEKKADAKPEASEDIQVCLVDVADARRLVDGGEMVQAMQIAPLLTYLMQRRTVVGTGETDGSQR